MNNLAVISDSNQSVDEIMAHERLLAYGKRMWRGFEFPEHIVRIASILQKVESGEIRRVIINMPPRFGKSLLCTELFPAWYLGRNPSRKVILATYGGVFAGGFGRKVRNQLADPLFQRIFPECHLSDDSSAKNQFSTLEKGEYHAVGVGGPITGKGADLLIIDDPVKNREEAESETYREKTKDWYRSVAYTRLEPNGAIIIIQTRWHTDDLTGWVLDEHKQEQWHELILPAIDEDTESALWPERFSLERLHQIKNVLGPYEWSALYQQRPTVKEGNILKEKHWRFWSALPSNCSMIQSWDLTFKEARHSYVVGQVWAKQGPNCYLVDQFREKVGFSKTIGAILRMRSKYPMAKRIFIEDKANGPAVMDALKNKISGIIPVQALGSKVERVNAISHLVEAGNVYLPNPTNHPWVKEFIQECNDFPNGKNDDQCDAMSMALAKLDTHDPVERLRKLLQW